MNQIGRILKYGYCALREHSRGLLWPYEARGITSSPCTGVRPRSQAILNALGSNERSSKRQRSFALERGAYVREPERSAFYFSSNPFRGKIKYRTHVGLKESYPLQIWSADRHRVEACRPARHGGGCVPKQLSTGKELLHSHGRRPPQPARSPSTHAPLR